MKYYFMCLAKIIWYLNLFGLILNFTGVFIMYINTPPLLMGAIVSNSNDGIKRDILMHKRNKIGMGVLFIGFIFQFLGFVLN